MRYLLIVLILFFSVFAFSQGLWDEVQKAHRYINSGNVQEAIKIYNHLLEKNTQDVVSNRDYLIEQLANIYMQMKDYAKAENLVKSELLKREGFGLNIKLAEIYEATQRTEKAEEIYTKLLKMYPTNTYVYKKIGDMYFRKGELNVAISYWHKYANYSPGNLNSILQLASVYQEHRLFDEAVKMYGRARKLKGDDFLYSAQLAYIYQMMGDSENAVFEYAKLIVKEPQNFQYYQGKIREIIQNAEDKMSAILKIEDIHYKFPKNIHIIQMLANLYIENDLQERAIRILNNLSASERSDMLMFIADELFRKKDYQKAIIFYDEALKGKIQKTQKIKLLQQKALSFKEMGMFPSAIVVFKTIVEEFPQEYLSYQSYFYLGELLEDIDIEEAEFYYEKFLTFPTNEKTLKAKIKIADISFRKIELATAKERYNTLVYQTDEKDKEYCIFMTCLCDYYLYNFEDAKLCLQSFVDRYPQSFFANDALQKISFIKMYSDFDFVPLKLYAEGEIQSIAKNYPKALDAFKMLCDYYSAYPLSELAKIQIARIYKNKGLYELSLKVYEDFLLLYPYSPNKDEVYNDMISIYKVLQDEKKATIFYNKLQEEFPESFYLQ